MKQDSNNLISDEVSWSTYLFKRILFTTAPATFDTVCLVSAILGGIVGSAIVTAILLPQYQISLYAIAFGIFHLTEFWVTARYNSEKLGMASFLLHNGLTYMLAQISVVVETFIRRFYLSQPFTNVYLWTSLGITFIVCGQILRTASMIQASCSFSHLVQHQRRQDHILVTSGIYGVVRHPSYLAYFIWAMGNQLLLQNFVNLVLFFAILCQFFHVRVTMEEESLMAMFGSEYKEYRSRVPSGIPFMS